MATTWIKALHKGSSIKSALGRSLDYIKNSEKTDDGELVCGYECDPFTAQSEFLLSKTMYQKKTGRDQGKHNVIAYHVRMSFQHGEVTPEKALELGRELAMRWTKGKHQFIVAAHINTKNPHVHIIYNSVNLDHNGKYQDFKRSAIALRKVSDWICLENGLSIIEKPKLSKGHNRAEYMGEGKIPSIRSQLQDLMDRVILYSRSREEFFRNLQESGVEIKNRGKQLSFKPTGAKRFIRQDTLGDDYSMLVIAERISGDRAAPPKRKKTSSIMPKQAPKFNLLIDIEKKIQEGYGVGFEKWAKLENLKAASKTLIFLQEQGLDNYDLLTTKVDEVKKSFDAKSNRIKIIEARQKEISELQKQIGTYRKTRDVYFEYKKLQPEKPSVFSKITKAKHPAEKFYEDNRSAITLHEAAKRFFDSKGFDKKKALPKIKALKEEYAILESEKRKLYSGRKKEREEMNELIRAKENTDRILGDSFFQGSKNRRNEIEL